MIPGTVSKLSEQVVVAADKIFAKTDVIVVTGTTPINTIVPAFGRNFAGLLFVVASGTIVTLGAAGNIQAGASIPVNRVAILVFVKAAGVWAVNTTP